MLKAAIHGLGRWGSRLVESVQGSAKIRIVKGISRTPERHREFSEKTGIALVSSYADALRDPQVDAVVLATPHSLHYEHIVQAAQAGKHVYVEKPITLTRATAEKAVEACRAARITLGLGFNRRFAPSFLEMTRRIRAGEIGEVLHIEGQHSGPTGYRLKAGNWRATRAEAPAGGMTARGIHTLDAMIQIAGLVRTVYAFSDRRKLPADVDIDDTTSMLLKFASGATGYLGTVFVTGELYRVHVFGSKGWLELRGDKELIACGLEGPAERITLPAADKEKALLEAFADAVGARQPFMVPPEQAVNGIAVLDAIVASAASGQPVSVPQKALGSG
ncbi:MAG: Gfo/Idh/MocA family oxidoreductase [Betaproteobacteria bacterium]|nr:Gfo/Idh/MocA family oxidoreductase [Betaproteobacteria bacterium]